jgi:hypothetical protein
MISFFLVSIILANQVNTQKTRKKIQSRKNQLLNKYHATLNTMNNFDPDNGNIFD